MVKLSIIIPSLRPKNLERLVESILVNTFVPYEIIIIGKEYQDVSFLSNIKLGNFLYRNCFLQDRYLEGTTRAIQQGLEQASGEYVVTLSDDCIVEKHWADFIITEMEIESSLNPEIPLIGNFIVFDQTGTMTRIGYFGKQFSMFPIIKQSDILKIGGYYSTEFNAFYSDPDLGIRLAEYGGKIVNSKVARIFHPYNPDTLHMYNKNSYFKKDEETFIKKWDGKFINHPFRGCEVIE